eukprot:TRINITY_DN47635_c0_g1_i1.p1 TRINITY_DN47635_c0_g1~~TRINITY_DN47635_c0_g1_i1.p1  ORF type:complete len:342 (+),score=70.88 TRINITY_DN47635_c0_g1_i1:46-1071(+)
MAVASLPGNDGSAGTPVSDVAGAGAVATLAGSSAPVAAGHPVPGDKVTVHYVCRVGSSSGEIVDSTRAREQAFTFTLGRGEACPGLERAVALLRPGQSDSFTVDPELAFGSAGCGGGIVPAGASLHYEVDMVDVEPAMCATAQGEDFHGCSFEERLEAAMRGKDSGNAFFKAADFQRAIAAYRRALTALHFPGDPRVAAMDASNGNDRRDTWPVGPVREERSRVVLACHLNAAQCCLKLASTHAEDAYWHASEALNIDGSSAKALFRRGAAALALDRPEDAQKDLTKAARLEPQNPEIRAQLRVATERSKADLAHKRSTFGGMFDRRSGGEAQPSAKVFGD